jgi:hypothetical protein
MTWKEKLFRHVTFSKGFLYGFGIMFLLPRKHFDQLGMMYYDLLEPETIVSANNENIKPLPTKQKK